MELSKPCIIKHLESVVVFSFISMIVLFNCDIHASLNYQSNWILNSILEFYFMLVLLYAFCRGAKRNYMNKGTPIRFRRITTKISSLIPVSARCNYAITPVGDIFPDPD